MTVLLSKLMYKMISYTQTQWNTLNKTSNLFVIMRHMWLYYIMSFSGGLKTNSFLLYWQNFWLVGKRRLIIRFANIHVWIFISCYCIQRLIISWTAALSVFLFYFGINLFHIKWSPVYFNLLAMKYILTRVAGYCFSVSLKYTENTPVLCHHLNIA